MTSAAVFSPKKVKGGDPIYAEDWNDLQNAILDLERLVKSMTEGVTIIGVPSTLEDQYPSISLESPVAEEASKQGTVPHRIQAFGQRVVGMITRQWVAAKVPRLICSLDVNEKFDRFHYYACEEVGGRTPLTIIMTYDPPPGKKGIVQEVYGPLYVNGIQGSVEKSKANEWQKVVQGVTGNWYEYVVDNRRPDELVKQIIFQNNDPNCILRIGNVIHIRSRIRLLERNTR